MYREGKIEWMNLMADGDEVYLMNKVRRSLNDYQQYIT